MEKKTIITFNKEEQEAMRQMLSVFAKIQTENKIDPTDYSTPFETAFNRAMNYFIEFMYTSEDTEKIVSDYGY